MTETVISMRKIIANIKRYWWICLLATAVAAAAVFFSTWRTYTVNKTAEAKNSYIGSATLYLSSENDRDNTAYSAILQSADTIAKIDAQLAAAGQEAYSSATDSIAIQSMSDSTAYGITVLSIGEERTQIIGQAVIDIVLEQAADVMRVETGQLSSLTVSPCLWYPDGTFTIVDSPEQRIVTLSVSDFLSWRKLVVVCAGFFVGAALIFAAVLFDDKIRDEEEVHAVSELPVLGTVKLAGGKAEGLPEAVLQEYLTARKVEKGLLLSVGNAKLSTEMRTCLNNLTEHRICGAQDLYTPGFSLDKIKEYDGVFLVMCLNRNTMKELRKAQEMLALLQINALALLLIR